jgi:hypothetical protein
MASINETIDEYEKKYPNLGKYYKVMYWTLSSYFYNFKSTKNDILQSNTRFDQEYGIVEKGLKKGGSMLLKLA